MLLKARRILIYKGKPGSVERVREKDAIVCIMGSSGICIENGTKGGSENQDISASAASIVINQTSLNLARPKLYGKTKTKLPEYPFNAAG